MPSAARLGWRGGKTGRLAARQREDKGPRAAEMVAREVPDGRADAAADPQDGCGGSGRGGGGEGTTSRGPAPAGP